MGVIEVVKKHAWQDGFAYGFAAGLKEGLKESRKRERNTIREIAMRLKNMGVDISLIAQVMKLPEHEVDAL